MKTVDRNANVGMEEVTKKLIGSIQDELLKVNLLAELQVHVPLSWVLENLKSEGAKLLIIDKIKKFEVTVTEDETSNPLGGEILGSFGSRVESLERIPQIEKIAVTLENDEEKIHIVKTLLKICDEHVENIEVSDKIRNLKQYNILELIDSIQDELSRVNVLSETRVRNPRFWTQDLESDEARLLAMDKVPEVKQEVFITLEKEEAILQGLDKFTGEEKVIATQRLKDDIMKLHILKKFNDIDKLKVIKSFSDGDIIPRAIDSFEKAEVLKRMYSKNELVLLNVDGRLLDDKYMNTLGEDKINVISNFPEIQKKIIDMSDTEYELYYSVLEIIRRK